MGNLIRKRTTTKSRQRGVPPPITASGLEFFRQKRRFFCLKTLFLGQFSTHFLILAKGGTPPHHGKRLGIFFAKNGVFCLKNTVFGPMFNRFFHHGKWPAKKLTGKKSRKRGFPPPPSQTFSVTGVFEPFPKSH